MTKVKNVKTNGSRTANSIRNSFFAILENGVSNIASFICRTVFIYVLGKTYLGFSGLFSDILTLLSLGELGVGTAILHSMYEPASKNDIKTVAGMLNLYKKIYHTIGICVFGVGLCLTPFLDFFVSDIPNMPELPYIYILYLLNTSLSYFFIYKKSILIVYQQSYIFSIILMMSVVTQNVVQIIALLLTKNFLIYLLIQVLFTLIANFSVSKYVDRNYEFLEKYKKCNLDKCRKYKIFSDVKAMFVSKLSSAVVTSTDNLLISKFVSTVVLGLYSNYTLFTTMLRTIVTKIFEALTGSVGNLVVSENKTQVYKSFRGIWFVNYWIVAFSCSTLFALVNPFINIWIGETYILNIEIVILICFNLYMRLIRNTFLTFIDTYGLFKELRIKCISEALINLIVSLILLIPLKLGVVGVLLGTSISNILTNFWFEPYLLFTKKFDKKMTVYFGAFIKYFIVAVFTAIASYLVCDVFIVQSNIIWFIIRMIFCILFNNLMYCLVFNRDEEFLYFIQAIKKVIRRA